jgi:hypothetical protein
VPGDTQKIIKAALMEDEIEYRHFSYGGKGFAHKSVLVFSVQ